MVKRKNSNPTKLNAKPKESFDVVESVQPKRPKSDYFPHIIHKYNLPNEQYFLNSFTIGKTNNVIPENWIKSKISFNDENITLFIDGDAYVIIHICDLDYLKPIKDLFSTKVFKYNFTVDPETQDVQIFFYLSQIDIVHFNKRIGGAIQWLMVKCFNIDMSDVFENNQLKTHENFEDLYSTIKSCRSNVSIENPNNLQHSSLLPLLRPYQNEAILWMINKEQNIKTEVLETLHPLYEIIELKSGISIFYDKYSGYITTTKPVVKYSQTGGILADEMGLGKTVEVLACILNNPRIIEQIEEQSMNESLEVIPIVETQTKYIKPKDKKIKKPKEKAKNVNLYSKLSPAKRAAQIWYENKLAEMIIKKREPRNYEDEIQCICGDFSKNDIIKCKDCSKRQHSKCIGYKNNDNHFICSQCWLNKPLIKSKATLIVSPLTISQQWSSEVQRHIRKDGLRVLEYNGIHQAGMIYPTELANYDLVITTYSVLQSEVNFTNDEPSTKSLRYAKRYNVPNTPLLNIEWWRLCLDEAQNVECSTSLVSEMARQLNAVHRWAVTGTPIQKNIMDIYGLTDYLLINPYNDINIWNYKLYYPYINGNKQNMIEFLSNILWRTIKKDVLDQIDLPAQSFEEHWLEFSAVEKFFYSREHELCAHDFLTKLKDYKNVNVALKNIDRRTLNQILGPLLSLRQACTHPHAVRGRYLASRKQVNSMEDLLDALIKKNTHDCTEAVRAVIAALNGEAGILLLQNCIVQAVDKYRETLTYMAQYDGKCEIQIDKLQRIHTLYNLSEILTINRSMNSISRTLRDDDLIKECETYQCKYMEKYITETRSALKETKLMYDKVNEQMNMFHYVEGEWFAELMDSFVEMGLEDELLKKVQSAVINSKNIKQYNLSGARHLSFIITTWIDKLSKQVSKLYSIIKEFEDALDVTKNFYINDAVIESATDCHLRPNKSNKNKPKTCLCCVLISNLKKYETLLFQMITKKNEKQSNQGTWHPSFEETLVRVVYSFAKSRNLKNENTDDGNVHLKLAAMRRQEFKELSKLYMYFDQQVSAQDELNMCKIRFRLRNSDGPVKVIQKKQNQALKNLNYEIENKFEFINLLGEEELDYNFNLLEIERVANDASLKKLMGTHNYLETLKKQQYAGQDPDPCPICKTQLIGTWSILHCGHCYCLDCIATLLERSPFVNSVTCSICRTKQSCTDISYMKLKSDDSIDDIEIKGSYSTKVHAIVRCVLKLQQTDEDVKVLIFSTWNAVLKVLSDAFVLNNITFEFVVSANIQDKLKKFKDEKQNITALLMPIRLGANGLNLIEATHIILVEPLMNPGEELQAIGRIHRIGQTKPTVVHRFLIKSTIEENIYEAVSTNSQKWDRNKLTLVELQGLFVQENNSTETKNDSNDLETNIDATNISQNENNLPETSENQTFDESSIETNENTDVTMNIIDIQQNTNIINTAAEIDFSSTISSNSRHTST